MSEIMGFRLHCGCDECKEGESHYDAVIGNYNSPILDMREYKAIPQHEYDCIKDIAQAALNLFKVKGRHHSEIAMKELMKACGVEK